MQDNIWHENKRKKNIKFFNEIIYISKENGAISTFISGSGPTILIITKDIFINKIKSNILNIKNIDLIKPIFLLLEPNFEGVKVLPKK